MVFQVGARRFMRGDHKEEGAKKIGRCRQGLPTCSGSSSTRHQVRGAVEVGRDFSR